MYFLQIHYISDLNNSADLYNKFDISQIDYSRLNLEVEDFKRIMENSDRCVHDIKMRIEKSPYKLKNISQRSKSKESQDNGSLHLVNSANKSLDDDIINENQAEREILKQNNQAKNLMDEKNLCTPNAKRNLNFLDSPDTIV